MSLGDGTSLKDKIVEELKGQFGQEPEDTDSLDALATALAQAIVKEIKENLQASATAQGLTAPSGGGAVTGTVTLGTGSFS